jgi:LCP family protein required for cell wall assembly
MQDTQPYQRPRGQQARRVRRADPVVRARRPTNWRRRFLIMALLLLAAVVVLGVLGWQRAAAFNDAVSTQSALSWRLFGPFSGGDRVNVLLLGYSDESREGAFLSDSINVISIDRATDTTTMIPIPRDLWVEGVPEVPQNMKINEAFRIGTYAQDRDYGGELAAKAVTQVTGLRIDGWISLDFQGFEAMVNAVGGITVDNPTAFAYTWDEPKFLAGQFEFAFEAGPQRMNGQQALDYSRARYTSVWEESSDFARLARQQRVLQAIKAEVRGWDTISKGMALADALAGHLRTNLSVIDLGMLAGKIDHIDRRIELLEGETLVATTNTIGQYILVPIGATASDDYGPLHEYIDSALRAPIASPSATD